MAFLFLNYSRKFWNHKLVWRMVSVFFIFLFSGNHGEFGKLHAKTHTGILQLNIENIKVDHQPIIIYICTSEEFLETPCRYNFISFADSQKVTLKWKEAPMGEFAIFLYHDQDGNGSLKRGLIFPKEGYGFSNITGIITSKPKFSKANFRIESGKILHQNILLRY